MKSQIEGSTSNNFDRSPETCVQLIGDPSLEADGVVLMGVVAPLPPLPPQNR